MHSTSFTASLAVAASLVSGVVGTWPPPAQPWSTTGGTAGVVSNGSESGSTTGSAQDQVTVVNVGANGALTFDPPNVQVPVGSHVQFQFHPDNHSVVQASFDAPCVPINNVDPTTKGFFSGFMPADTAAPDILVFDYQVTSADPVWFYCSQEDHCQQGMVGAINAESTGDSTLANFKKSAAMSKQNITPGVPPAGVTWGGGASPTGGAAPPPGSTGSAGGGSEGGGSTGGGSVGGGSSGGGSTVPPPSQSSPPPVANSASRLATMGLGFTALVAVLML